jgi:DNA replication protein DnaC
MKTLDNILTSLNTTLKKKGILISDKRCSNEVNGQRCNKLMQVVDGKETCFYCEEITKEDKLLARETKTNHDKLLIERIFNKDSLINPRLKECAFDNYEPETEELQKAKSICQRYANNFKRDNPVNLILIGPYGTGKSHMSVSILKAVVEKGMNTKEPFQGLFISTPKLMTKLKSTYNKKSDHTENELLETIEKVDLLILDDIGAELKEMESNPDEEKKANQWAVGKLFEIVDGRIGKHTIYTSNFEYGRLMSLYGERNFSRMMENTHPLKMNGENYRLREFK